MSHDWLWGLAVLAGSIIGFFVGYYLTNRNPDNTRNAGDILVTEDATGRKLFSLELNCEPDDLLEQKRVIFDILGDRK